MKNIKSCLLIDQYLGYLITIKARSSNTIIEYRTDLLQFFKYVSSIRGLKNDDYNFADLDFIKSITLADMYGFIAYCQSELNSAPGTRARKIVSIRQFWKYLKIKAHLIDNNIAEELETPKLPKRIPHYLTLEESVRLLIEARSSSARDNCIITIFLNCALRLSELAALNIDQINSDVLTINGKGNKERKIFITPAVKQALSEWMILRNGLVTNSNALFISRNNQRISSRAVQNLVRKHIIATGLNPNEISTHKLRHTSATLLYKYGHVDIRALQQILGHESIATTEIYTHVDEAQLQAAINTNPLAMMFS